MSVDLPFVSAFGTSNGIGDYFCIRMIVTTTRTLWEEFWVSFSKMECLMDPSALYIHTMGEGKRVSNHLILT